MIVISKNGRKVLLRQLASTDADMLTNYLQQLSDETCKYFGPHPFDLQSVTHFFASTPKHLGFIGIDLHSNEIIAYAVLKIGFLEHDRFRLSSYGFIPHSRTDCTFAPSVADKWQSLGIGGSLFLFILSYLKVNHFKRIILWGGVQNNNEKAVSFYTKHGFESLGNFEYKGHNKDMALVLQ